MTAINSSQKSAVVWAVIIAVATFFLFAPALDYKFVTYDDDQYVYQNPIVMNGLTVDGIKQAWTGIYASYWSPVLWMSLMTDASVHGTGPFGFHLTNNLLHAVNAALVFLLLRFLVGATLPAALGAAIFAWHPLRVESVAWITERKDVLSLFWGLLSVFAYLRYARQPGIKRMLLVFVLLVTGLLSKPNLIVLPFLLLILDYWPLKRAGEGVRKLIVEKALLWVAVAASVAITLLAQRHALVGADEAPLHVRILTVPATYIFYIWKTIWPSKLTILYPDMPFSWMNIATTTFALAAVTLALLTRPARSPGLAAGWWWFLVALLPASGLIRSGTVHLADRFTYLPSIGISIAIAWALTELSKRHRWQTVIIPAMLIPAALAVATRADMPRWRDSITLYSDALRTAPHDAAHYNMGNMMLMLKRPADAAQHFAHAAILNPARKEAHYNFGVIMASQGAYSNAVIAFRKTTDLDPADMNAWINLGNSYFLDRHYDDAIDAFSRALQLDPENPRINNNLAWLLASTDNEDVRDLDRALDLVNRAVVLAPGRPEFHDTRALVLATRGDFEAAVKSATTAITLYQDAGLEQNARETNEKLEAYKAGRNL